MINTGSIDLEGFAELLITRTRTILWIALFAGLAFTTVELVVAPRLAAPFVVKCVGISLTTAALLLTRQPWAQRHALPVSLVIVVSAYLLTATSGIVSPSHEYETTAVLFVGAALTTATLLPWGVWPQVGTVLVAATLLSVAVVRADGNLHVLTDDPAVAVVFGFILSLATASEMQRHRMISQRELEARCEAERKLRVLNAELERRVVERTCELQDANARLQALSAHLEEVREDERTRMAREVHDKLGQLLTALKIDIDLLPRQVTAVAGSGATELLRDKLSAMSALALAMIQSVRRIAEELRPSLLDDLGLTAAIEWHVREFEGRSGIRCTAACEADPDLDSARAAAVFRIAQEALANVAQHAHATHVHLGLHSHAGLTVLEVQDDGRGITDAELRSSGSLGLFRMRERAHLLGGSVEISGSAGQGTTVRARIPQPVRNRAAAPLAM